MTWSKQLLEVIRHSREARQEALAEVLEMSREAREQTLALIVARDAPKPVRPPS